MFGTFSEWFAATTLQIDLGSAVTRLASGGTVLAEIPTCVALHRQTKQVVATGARAKEYIGKAPPTIAVVEPFFRGRVRDGYALQLFLRQVLQRSRPQHQRWWQRLQAWILRPQIVLSVPSSLSRTEQRLLQDMFRELGYRQVTCRLAITAAYTALFSQKIVGESAVVMNLGHSVSELGFFSHKQLVHVTSLPVAGVDFTQALLREIQRLHHCEVGWQTAERVKETLGISSPNKPGKIKKIGVRGRSSMTSLPTTVQMTTEESSLAYQHSVELLIQHMTVAFQTVAPEMMADTLDQGIVLTGGASLLTGLAEVIADALQTPVVSSPSALTDVVRGL